MRVVELSGGVGGARLARGFTRLPGVDFTVVVNVGDDDLVHGLHVSPDLDTVAYTLAGLEGPQGWGRRHDTFTVNSELARFGVDNTFQLGDLDLALNIYRTDCLARGHRLSEVTRHVAESFGLDALLIPSTDDHLATEVKVPGDGWISFQEYFVIRSHEDRVEEIRYAGASKAMPAPGVIEAIDSADLVVVGPSNPPLSIWPILAVKEIEAAVRRHSNVVGVSPLVGSRALKGPADKVMASLGLPPGNAGVVKAYDGIIDRLVIHVDDADDVDTIAEIEVIPSQTIIRSVDAAARLAKHLIEQ